MTPPGKPSDRPPPGTGRAAMTSGTSAVVVIPGLNDDQFVIGRAVDQAVLVIDPPGPETGQIPAQRFRLTNTLERGPPCFLDQPQQAAQHLLVGRGPVREVFPALGVE